MTTLTPQAEQALLALRERHKDYKERKSQIEAEVRAVLEERLSIVKGERDKALRLAAEAGVPRTRLGEAIGTSNYRTVQEILATTEQMVKQSESGWTLIEGTGSNSYTLQVSSLGVGRISGSAEVLIEDGEIHFVSGDEYVVPSIYREGLAEDVIANA